MAEKITDVTRRDIRDALSSLNVWGRLEEVEFLSRLYDLDSLPSGDARFQTARGDIIQHRLMNYDWDDDWIFTDPRLGLASGDDGVFLRFLAELLHPAVRSDQSEVYQIAETLNGLLAPDGYQLKPVEHVSGRPVFGAVEIEPAEPVVRPSSVHFTKDIRPLVSTAGRLAELDGSDLEKEVLHTAEARLEEPEHDNWDGGTYYHTLTLVVPVELFARLGDQVRGIEERIASRIAGVLRAPDSHHVTAVVIQPSLAAPSSRELVDVVAARSQRPIPQFWAPAHFRLFISHVTSFKQRATALRQELGAYYISGFVAHETIDAGELWQREIEAGLRSMHAMAALITPDFHDSDWTDQEVGWALGSGISVVPVRREADPYGFLAEIQGIQGVGLTVAQVADKIFEALLRVPGTKGALLEALVAGFERSDSYREARDNLSLLERARAIPEPLLGRIEVAARSNDQIADSTGVPARVRALLRAGRGAI